MQSAPLPSEEATIPRAFTDFGIASEADALPASGNEQISNLGIISGR